jgi:hypothetical protein
MTSTVLGRPSAGLVLGRAARGLACMTALMLVAPLNAQSIASRVAQAPDGVVRLEYESRYGVCGDGRELVGFRSALFGRNFQTFRKWETDNCSPGPLRVTLHVTGGRVQQLRTQIGGRWPASDDRVTDLGMVAPAEASAYFFSLVPQLERAGGKDRMLLPAVLADNAAVIAPLIALAQDTVRFESTRRVAMMWLGMFGDPAARRYLHTVIESPTENREIRSHAIFALAHGEDTPDSEFVYLRGLYPRFEDDKLKEAILFAMAQGEEPGSRWLIERAMDTRERSKLRKNAFFWAGQSQATRTADLVRAYRNMTEEELRDHAIFVLSQRSDEAALQALLTIAREDPDKKARGKALFWLAQKNDPRVTKLIADLVLR